mmetsp:Transcript_49382/g.148745  ORF Transcript_49382/g.148745 Transcript_49382/m.148745 type:complete len:231 (-) Transcript_49382:364-1056(-)
MMETAEGLYLRVELLDHAGEARFDVTLVDHLARAGLARGTVDATVAGGGGADAEHLAELVFPVEVPLAVLPLVHDRARLPRPPEIVLVRISPARPSTIAAQMPFRAGLLLQAHKRVVPFPPRHSSIRRRRRPSRRAGAPRRVRLPYRLGLPPPYVDGGRYGRPYRIVRRPFPPSLPAASLAASSRARREEGGGAAAVLLLRVVPLHHRRLFSPAALVRRRGCLAARRTAH